MEEWKEIYGFPRYEVSNLGNLRSKDCYVKDGNSKLRISKGKELKGSPDTDGYLKVILYFDGESACSGVNSQRYTRTIHRLVAETFIPNPEGKPVVNHKNSIRTDNRADNLEWVTVQENTRHAFDKGLRVSMIPSKKVARLDIKTGECLEIYKSIRATQDQGYGSGHVSSCCRGQRKTHKGFAWKFID